MKRLLLFLCLQWVMAVLWAVPAYRKPFEVLQSDGSTLKVRLLGDEHFHYYATMDDIPVVEDGNGDFYYAMMDDHKMVKSSLLAHAYKERNAEERDACRKFAVEVCCYIDTMALGECSRIGKEMRRMRRINGCSGKTKLQGSKKALVILVDFANLSMTEADANRCFSDRFNKVGYNENNHVGSVHDYFYAQSYGALDLSFDVVGPVTMNKNFGYYGKDMDGMTDVNVREMVVEACKSVDDKVDFRNYDWDGDGEVEQIYIIYAGYGEAYGASSNTIWPHKSSLSRYAIELDGVKIDTYACSCELSGRYGDKIDGIGTACHEFSHCLGLPDLYDTSKGGGVGMGYWDVMCSGSYSGATGCGEAPCGYSAYERWFLGWLDFKELTDICRIKDVPCVGDEPVAYAIYNDNNRDEFLLLENRQNKNWFSFVHESNDCHGLLVTHIDYSEEAWEGNTVNADEKRQRVTYIPADNDLTGTNLEGTLFPGSQGVSELIDDSHVSVGGRWNTANKQGSYTFNAPITNIREENGLISFDFKGGLFVATPYIYEAEEVKADGFDIRWDFADGADAYAVEVVEDREYTSLADSVLNPRVHLMIGDIVENKYRLQGLKTAKYKFRVKAMKDGASSSWSDYKYVNLSDVSSINPVYGEEEGTLWYDLDGTKDKGGEGIKISPTKGKVYKKAR